MCPVEGARFEEIDVEPQLSVAAIYDVCCDAFPVHQIRTPVRADAEARCRDGTEGQLLVTYGQVRERPRFEQ